MNRPPAYPMPHATGTPHQMHTATSAFIGNGAVAGPATHNGPLNGTQPALPPVRYPAPPPPPMAHMGGVKPTTPFHQQANQTTMMNNIDLRSTLQSPHNSGTHLMSPQYSGPPPPPMSMPRVPAPQSMATVPQQPQFATNGYNQSDFAQQSNYAQQLGMPPDFTGRPMPPPLPPNIRQPPPSTMLAQQLPPTAHGQPPPTSGQNAQQPSTGQSHGLLSNDLARLGFQDVHAPDRPLNLLGEHNILAAGSCDVPAIQLSRSSNVENAKTNADSTVMRCTINAVPTTSDLLKKCRLPFGLLLHPFRDLKSLNVISTSTIVRCKSCRTYINPFVNITDPRHWKCNICYRTNELPDEMNWDPVTKSYGDPTRRPEIMCATVEFIAPSEYMPIRKNLRNENELRPPQAAMYVFVLDVSVSAVASGVAESVVHAHHYSGYLCTLATSLRTHLEHMPGDERTTIAFLAVDSAVHFYRFVDANQPPMHLVVDDVDDMFCPCPDGLVVNMKAHTNAVDEFLKLLPTYFDKTTDTHSALGAAIQIAHLLIADNGGRITVMTTTMPDRGPGALVAREDPNERAATDVQHLTHATDFYQRLALECNGHQVAIDLFLMNTKPADLATLADMSRYCGGSILHFPGAQLLRNAVEMQRLEKTLQRYLTRKIGFEAVLRIRCTKGLVLRQFFGNFFVRSTDLLALPNVNPDAAMGVTIDYEDTLADGATASFQAALLYTSSRGDRRIRVHTLCLPVTSRISQIHAAVDTYAVVSMLAKLAADRAMDAAKRVPLTDVREAIVNACVDALASYAHNSALGTGFGSEVLIAPPQLLRLLPLYALALVKCVSQDCLIGVYVRTHVQSALSTGVSTRLDTRVAELLALRTLPVDQLMLYVYPALYALHTLPTTGNDEQPAIAPVRLPLTYACIDAHGVYLMDTGSIMYVYVCRALADHHARALFDAATFAHIDDEALSLPTTTAPLNEAVRAFVQQLNAQRPVAAALIVIREDSTQRDKFTRRLVDDRTESTYSYVDFLRHVRKEIPPKR